jgi:GTP-binding protein
MDRFRLKNAKFIQGATDYKTLLNHQHFEAALVGRSNVGKSTFLNRLSNQKSLARVSSTPGRTQELNLFQFDIKNFEEDLTLYLCDLPGFGFAKMSLSQKRKTEESLFNYLTSREELDCVILLIDSRRIPKQEEILIRQTAFAAGRRVFTIITKTDKLSKLEIKESIKNIARALSLEPTDIEITGSNINNQKIWERLLDPIL